MKKVLVVDDDPSVLKAVSLVLRWNGCEVLAVDQGEKCLAALREGFKGVVLMDIMMPGMSGWQTIGKMVEEHLEEQVLICMLTAKITPGSEGEGLEQYIFDYLPKPFDNTSLMGCVDNALAMLGL